ncbi:hypothetical protein GCM10027417_24770 [Glutamicibacter endophyticus]
MATKKVLVGRAKVSAKLSASLMNRSFAQRLRDIAPIDADGDMVVIPADPSESAVIVIHRMDRFPSETVAVATMLGTTLHVRKFRKTPLKHIPDHDNVQGGITVKEWFERILENKTYSFAASGVEFAAELSSDSLLTA